MRTLRKGVVGAAVLAVGATIALNTPIVAEPGGRNDHGGREQRSGRDNRGGYDNRGGHDERDLRGPGGPRGERGPRHGRPPGPSVEMIDDVAELTPEQRTKVSAVLNSMHEQMKRLHDDTRKQIDSILTAEQRERLEQAREMGPPHGPPPGEFDGPPPGDARPFGDGSRGQRGNRNNMRRGER